jgi:uncharacterized membrane protein
MIMKIIVFALTIAFTVTFVVELLAGDLTSLPIIECTNSTSQLLEWYY